MILLALVVWPAAAWAHGDASWIMREPRFLDRQGFHCCGTSDCAVVPRGQVMRVKGGWLVLDTGRLFHDDDRDLYVSIDAEIWLCRRPDVMTGRPVDRCLFVPGLGV